MVIPIASSAKIVKLGLSDGCGDHQSIGYNLRRSGDDDSLFSQWRHDEMHALGGKITGVRYATRRNIHNWTNMAGDQKQMFELVGLII